VVGVGCRTRLLDLWYKQIALKTSLELLRRLKSWALGLTERVHGNGVDPIFFAQELGFLL
jgi:hypothetical protein